MVGSCMLFYIFVNLVLDLVFFGLALFDRPFSDDCVL